MNSPSFPPSSYLFLYSTDYRRTFSREVPIQFIGVWDTVASVGSIFPRNLPFASNNYITKTFRHAVSLDEHRAKFRSNLWHREVVHDSTDISAAPSAATNAPGAFRRGWNAIVKFFVGVTPEEELWERSNAKEEAEHTPTDVKEVHFSGCVCGSLAVRGLFADSDVTWVALRCWRRERRGSYEIRHVKHSTPMDDQRDVSCRCGHPMEHCRARSETDSTS